MHFLNRNFAAYELISLSLQRMNSLLENNKKRIQSLCQRYKVKTLHVFGSVLTSRFSGESDVDFLVEFKKEEIKDYFTNFFDFKSALEDTTGREVDLLENHAIRNPILKHNLNRTKKLIYGLKDSKTFVRHPKCRC